MSRDMNEMAEATGLLLGQMAVVLDPIEKEEVVDNDGNPITLAADLEFIRKLGIALNEFRLMMLIPYTESRAKYRVSSTPKQPPFGGTGCEGEPSI